MSLRLLIYNHEDKTALQKTYNLSDFAFTVQVFLIDENTLLCNMKYEEVIKISSVLHCEVYPFGSINDINLNDIGSFYTKSSRADNDKTNKIREKILMNIKNVPSIYFFDKKYGKQWIKLKDEFYKAINIAFNYISNEKEFGRFTLESKGGRQFNYDFKIIYTKKDGSQISAKLEFKCFSNNIKNLPQVLQLDDKKYSELFFGASYASFFYRKYLKDAFPDLTLPSEEQYIKYVSQVPTKRKIQGGDFFENIRSIYNEDKKSLRRLLISL